MAGFGCPPRVGFYRVPLLMIVSAAGGALIATLATSKIPPKSYANMRDEFIPPQTLRFVDARGSEIASLIVSDNGNRLQLESVEVFVDTDNTFLTIHGQDYANLLVVMVHRFADFLDGNFNREWQFHSPQYQESPGPLKIGSTLALVVYRKHFLASGERLEKKIPSQEVRLKRKNGDQFAVLGLTETGDPVVGMTDRKGRLNESWVIGSDWPGHRWHDIAFFNTDGELWVSVEMRPNQPVSFMYTEPGFLDRGWLRNWVMGEGSDGTKTFVLDSTTGKPREGTSGPLLWAKRLTYSPVLPIRLVDNRNREIWKAP